MKKTIFAAAIAAMPLAASAATVHIDKFTVSDGPISTTAASVSSGPVANGSGFDRTITAMSNSSAGDSVFETGVSMIVSSASNELRMSGTLGSFGEYGVSYAANAGAVDLTDGGMNDRFRLQRLNDTDVSIMVSVNGTANEYNFTAVGGGVYELLFSAIAEDASAVTQIDFKIKDTSVDGASDVAVKFLGAVSEVPLPAGGALMLAGLGALSLVRRRK